MLSPHVVVGVHAAHVTKGGYIPTPNFVKILLFIAIQIPLECTNVDDDIVTRI